MEAIQVIVKRMMVVIFAFGLGVASAFGDGAVGPSECPSAGIDLVTGSSDEGPAVIEEMEGRSWTWLASEGVDLKAIPPVGFLLFLR